MTEKTDEGLLRALGLAVQVLEELPDKLRPGSNIADMRRLLAGNSTGRDPLIVTQAVAAALAFRSLHLAGVAPDWRDADAACAGFNNRVNELASLFKLAATCDAYLLALYFEGACRNLAPAPPGSGEP